MIVLLSIVLMIRRPPSATRTDTLFPYTTLFRSHHEGVFELPVDVFLHVFEVVILRALRELAAQDLFPVGAPFDFFHALAGDQRARPRRGRRLQLRRIVQVLVVEGERSDERRVGKECVSTCRSRGSTYY